MEPLIFIFLHFEFCEDLTRGTEDYKKLQTLVDNAEECMYH